MGKGKGRGDEYASRVNYLFQAGKMVANDVPQLSQYYGQVLTVITEKTAAKKDFTMKRSMCKRCHAVLQIGENATYRLRKSRHKKSSPIIIIGCLICGEKKHLPTSKGYRLNAETKGQIMNGNSSNGNRHAPPPAPPSSASASDNLCSNSPTNLELSISNTNAEMMEAEPLQKKIKLP